MDELKKSKYSFSPIISCDHRENRFQLYEEIITGEKSWWEEGCVDFLLEI